MTSALPFDIFPLNLFPPGGLESSVVTTVWVGAMVIVFLNLRFGMTLAGLVVPGYLVPLFFVKPISASVVVFEGIVTYVIAYLFANKILVKMGFAEMFGRERFFSLILISVIVRVLFDFYLLPIVGSYYEADFGRFDYQNHLQSFGLIIVALIANQMWNGGFKKGVGALTLYVTLTYLIIDWVLVPFTNFSLAGLNYMYEDLATSLLSSPKAYIILITTAFVASRMNLKYGWEFNGILIPALLGLQWYQPEKLLFTFVEAIIILMLGKALLSSRLFKHMNMEGSRLFLLFFNVGFVYKILLGYVLIDVLPAAKITDYYGFGYVVSTLIAIKVHQKHIVIQMTRTTLQTSFLSIILASVIGFALANINTSSQVEWDAEHVSVSLEDHRDIVDLYNQKKFESFDVEASRALQTPQNILAFERTVKWVSEHIESKDRLDSVLLAVSPLSRQGFKVYHLDDVLVLHLPSVGFYALRLGSQSQLIVQVPRAKSEVGTDLLSLQLFDRFKAKAVMLDLSSGQDELGRKTQDSSLQDGYFQVLHRHLSHNNVVQVRGDLRTHEQRRLKRLRIQSQSANIMTVKKRLPSDLPMDELVQLFPDLQFDWYPKQNHNPQRSFNAFGFAELYISKREVQKALGRLDLLPENAVTQLNARIDGYLLQWVDIYKRSIARKSSERYKIPTEKELLYWDQEILTPLVLWLAQFEQQGWSENTQGELRHLAYLASGFGYVLTRFKHQDTGNEYLVLYERENKENKAHWASLFINLSARSDYFIQVPNPYYEASSFEFGANLFEKSGARFLLLAGSHPWANSDGSSNVTKLGNRHTLFHLIHQVIVREAKVPDLLPMQIRGYSFQAHRPFPQEDVLVSLWQRIASSNSSASVDSLLQHLNDYNLTYRIANGDVETSSYTFSNNQQSAYLSFKGKEDFVSVWLNPAVRRSFRSVRESDLVSAQMQALNISTSKESLRGYVQSLTYQKDGLEPELKHLLLDYSSSKNIQFLSVVQQRFPNVRLHYVQDITSLQGFIVLLNPQGQWLGIVNLATFSKRIEPYVNADSLSEFISHRAVWLGGDE